MSAAPMAEQMRLLSYRQVADLTGLSRATIWRRVRDGSLAAPLQISTNRVGWLARDIAEWLDSRPKA